MVDTLNNNERVTGQDAILKFAADGDDNAKEFKITNVSWSRDIGTTDIQHNDNLKASKALTDIRFSGSFEYSGQSEESLNQVMYADASEAGSGHERHEPKRGTLTVRETKPDGGSVSYSFRGCIVTSQSRDLPGSDSASTSFDWEAEDMVQS